jgi:cytochrome c1
MNDDFSVMPCLTRNLGQHLLKKRTFLPWTPHQVRSDKIAGLLLLASFTFIGCSEKKPPSSTLIVVAPPPKSDATAVGRKLYSTKACSACHSLNGTPGVGPTFAGLYGKTVELKDGSKVVADDAYLRKSITDPNAQITKGFAAVMPKQSFSEEEIQALISFIKSLSEAEKATQK